VPGGAAGVGERGLERKQETCTRESKGCGMSAEVRSILREAKKDGKETLRIPQGDVGVPSSSNDVLRWGQYATEEPIR